MTIGEAVVKDKISIGKIIKHPRNNKPLRVKSIIPNDKFNSGVLCHYVNPHEQEELIKRGYTCIKLMCYDDYIPYLNTKG